MSKEGYADDVLVEKHLMSNIVSLKCSKQFLGPCAEGLVDIRRHCDDKAKSSIMIAITDGLWSIYRDIMTLWVQTSLENVYSDIMVTPSNRLLISTLQDLMYCPFDQL